MEFLFFTQKTNPQYKKLHFLLNTDHILYALEVVDVDGVARGGFVQASQDLKLVESIRELSYVANF